MEKMEKKKLINIVRWSASIIGTLIVVLTLLFFIGYLIEGKNKPAANFDISTILTFVVWGIGLAGLLLALWKPGTGGLISFLSLIVFNIMVALSPNPESHYSFVLLIFLLPSILFLIFWWLNNRKI